MCDHWAMWGSLSWACEQLCNVCVTDWRVWSWESERREHEEVSRSNVAAELQSRNIFASLSNLVLNLITVTYHCSTCRKQSKASCSLVKYVCRWKISISAWWRLPPCKKKKKREETINAIKSFLYSKSKAVCLKVQDLINYSFWYSLMSLLNVWTWCKREACSTLLFSFGLCKCSDGK